MASCCSAPSSSIPRRGEVEQLVEPRAVERHLLRGRLHLHETPVARHDDVDVDVGVRILRVVEVEQGTSSTTPTETAATDPVSAFESPNRSSAREAATYAPVIAAQRVPPSACSTSQSR